MLFVVVIVIGMSLIPFGVEAAFLVACFIGLLVGWGLYALGLVSVVSLGVLIGGLLFIIIYLVFSSPKSNYQ
jgi:hypothetical protein